MSAYVIVNVNVKIHDPDAYREYVRRAPSAVAAYGGRYLARAKAWLDTPEYGAVKHLRHRNATSEMVLIEGLAQQPA
jgi:uncharacterized protein (DUF1330 family)